jgi:hypothetical protein
MQYRFGTALRALTDLTYRHKRHDVLNEEAFDCTLNVYYRRWMILEDKGHSFDLFSSNLSENMIIFARVQSQSSYIDQYLDRLLNFGASATSGKERILFDKLQCDFIDSFKYGIDQPQKNGVGKELKSEKLRKFMILKISAIG